MFKRSHLGFIITTITFLFLFYDARDLPDYDSYQFILDNAELGGDWEILFIIIVYFFRIIGLSYDDFRNFVIVFGSLSLFLTLTEIDLKRLVIVRSAYEAIFHNLFLIFIILDFFLEYFIIKIRAGFAIGMISLAVYFFLLGGRVPRMISVALFGASFFIHQSTTIVLAAFMLLPFVWHSAPTFLLRNKMYFYLVSTCVALMVLVGVQATYESRGTNVFSSLNPVRFLALSVIPIIVYFFIPNETRTNPITSAKRGNTEISSYFVDLYIVFSITLTIFYFWNVAENSGEALTRVFTLASLPALFSLVRVGSTWKAPVSSCILMANALFFINTIYFQSIG